MGIKLYDHQKKAIAQLTNGSILCGGVGSGKSITSIAYYYICQGGKIDPYFEPLDDLDCQDLYIITTARKRDEKEWEKELIPFMLYEDEKIGNVKVIIDSWNNIGKYINVEKAFFIFDEQRVVGSGAWVKAFYKITKKNNWILLSATPGDCWMDYIPVFVANGFYKNKTDFVNQHVVYDYHLKFPKVDRYLNTGRLIRLRNKILVDMDFKRSTVPHHIDIYTEFDRYKYKNLFKTRWNELKEAPIENASELCYEARRLVNSDDDRINKVVEIVNEKRKAIIFYSFDYELELLHKAFDNSEFEVAEWNGHKHQQVPMSSNWVYFVQYTAGAEAWNCITTDTIIFYSQHYSYKVMVQASGRIDRLNTPYTDLYYYHLKSRSGIDLAISKALSCKKKFNETKFVSDI